jgi:hypothetical protein
MTATLARCDIETVDALRKLCDRQSEITRADATALAVALLLELRSRPSSTRR